MKQVILILLLFLCSFGVSYAFGNKEQSSDDASQEQTEDTTVIDYTKEVPTGEDILPVALNKIDFNQLDNKYITFSDDVNIDELIYRSRNNLLYLYDYRYKEAVQIKKNGRRMFFASTLSAVAIGGLAFVSGAFIEDKDLSQGLSIPLTVLSSVSGFGGAIPALVMWNIGSAREQNIVRKYYRFNDKIELLDLYDDEDSNYLEND